MSILAIHLITAAIYFTQKIYKGIIATYKELFLVNVISLVLTAMSFFSLVILKAITDNDDYYQLFITLPLGIYTFIFDIVGVSEAQQISKSTAFFNLMIAYILISIPFVIVIVLFYKP